MDRENVWQLLAVVVCTKERDTRHWSSIPMVANSVYASVGKCIVTNCVKSSFDQGTLF